APYAAENLVRELSGRAADIAGPQPRRLVITGSEDGSPVQTEYCTEDRIPVSVEGLERTAGGRIPQLRRLVRSVLRCPASRGRRNRSWQAFSELSQNSTSALSRLCGIAPATVHPTRKGPGRPPLPVDAPPKGGGGCPPHRS